MMRGMANVSLAGKHQRRLPHSARARQAAETPLKSAPISAAKFYLSTNAPHASSTNLQQK
jgi:hypothetical protein